MRGVRVHRPALPRTRIHGVRAAAIFDPNFYPKGQRGGIEMSYLLVKAANRSDGPECVTSLPSWSCGFDSRRPLQLPVFSRFTVQLVCWEKPRRAAGHVPDDSTPMYQLARQTTK
jgi:hypothetical protein